MKDKDFLRGVLTFRGLLVGVQVCFLFSCLCYLLACSGPRNIQSSSPFISPVPLEKGATAVEADYFTHSRPSSFRDSAGVRDNGFSLNLSYMLRKKTMLFAYMDVKNERDRFFNSTDQEANLHYNAGFDSSMVSGKRHSWGAGIERFSAEHQKITKSFAASAAFTRFALDESGLLLQAPYHRFYTTSQLSFSLQGNLLYSFSKRAHLAWTSRLTVLYSFKPDTDYTSEEKYNAGLHDKKTNVFLGIFGLYGDYQPFKRSPLYLTGQFFNDLAFWNKAFAGFDPGRTNIKGTGVSLGLKYVFKLAGKP